MANTLRKMKPALLPLGVIVFGALLAAWLVMSRPEAQPKPPQEKIWPVQVLNVSADDVQPEIAVYGEIRAVREAEIRAMVAGRLVSLNPELQDGNRLAAGTELAVIDPADYENRLAEQRAELARQAALLDEYERELEWESRLRLNAERQVELASRALERINALQRDGRESKKARDDAEAALASSEQNLLQRSQAIARIRARAAQQAAAYDKTQATLANAERELARTRVVAPFDGYVTDVRLALGKLVAVGESLGRLLSASELEARFELPEADFARLLPAEPETSAAAVIGREVTVIWRLGDSERRFRAHITRVGAEIDPTLGGIELMASVDGAAATHGLRAGAFVEVHIPDVVYRDVYRLPARALSEEGFIYVLRDERLESRQAEVVRRLGEEILVRADLGAGDGIVARAFAGIGPGLRARAL